MLKMRSLPVISLLLIFSLPVLQAEQATVEDRSNTVEKKQSINDRVTRIERILDNNTLLDMHNLIISLKQEVSALRGMLEVQAHTIEELKEKQRSIYGDVDNRLSNIENSDTNSPVENEVTYSQTDSAIAETNDTESTSAEPDGTNNEDATTETTTQVATESSNADPALVEAEYQRAFKLLRESQYDQAIKAFKEFLGNYPDSAYSDNAQYWLAETNYVNQNYELAINEYQALLNTYPKSRKNTQALLKIGYSYAELGNTADAKKTLEEVKRLYPGTTEATLADERLRQINSANNT